VKCLLKHMGRLCCSKTVLQCLKEEQKLGSTILLNGFHPVILHELNIIGMNGAGLLFMILY
jgi:hypothetical protein